MLGIDGKGPRWFGSPGTVRGKGRNRRFGRSIGCGMGQGMVRRNMLRDRTPYAIQAQSPQDSQQAISKNQELDMLKQQAQMLQHQTDSILNRIDELSKGKQIISKDKTSLKAFINKEKCTGCGICVDVCKQEAIAVDNIAKVNLEKCIGCGVCVDTCPNEALTLS